MGKVFSILNRQVNRFNVENRAQRVISKEKPTPAPRHPSTLKELKQILTDHPEAVAAQLKKNSQLDDRLKQIYVVSHDPEQLHSQPEQVTHTDPAEKFNRTRQLPLDRQPYVESEFGFQEPAVIPRGRCSLRQALKFISDHQTYPSTWSAASIAKEYHLTEDSIDKVLQYYRTFELFIPQQDEKSRAMFATPSTGEKLEAGETSSQERK